MTLKPPPLDERLNIPRELHLKLCAAVIEVIAWRYGNDAADYWAWNETPMPCGHPLPSQYIKALRWAFSKGPAPVCEPLRETHAAPE
jgi:hypothetical protein